MIPIAGLDRSLTATGLVTPDGAHHLISSRRTGLDRLADIRDQVLNRLTYPCLVVTEGYAFARPNGAHQLGELGGVLLLAIHELQQPIAIVPPASLKRFATGKGNATKDQMLAAAVRRWPDIDDNNIADAAWLRAMGQAAYTQPDELTATQAAALTPIDWPHREWDNVIVIAGRSR